MIQSRNVRLVVAILLPTFCFAQVAAQPADSRSIIVIDADTVEQNGVRWRLVGLDAPEIHRAQCPAERQRGIIAAARLIALLASEGGRLEAAGKGREKFGRRLGRLIIGTPGRDWAEIAISEGHAVAWDGKGKAPDWCSRAP